MSAPLSDKEISEQSLGLDILARGLNRQLDKDSKECTELVRQFADSLPFVDISIKECVEERKAAAACLRAKPGNEADCFPVINSFSACVDRMNGALWPKAAYKASAN